MSKSKSIITQFSDIKPLEIKDWHEFLEKSEECFNENWVKPFVHKETLRNFSQLKLLGTGTFGNVILIKHKKNNKYFAMKAMEKEKIVRSNQLCHVKNEKLVLQSINFPMTVYLKYFFKDNNFIYLVMPFISGGELYSYLATVKKVDEDQARFYMSQVVLALEYLHFLNLVHRDLKPENILIDHTGYLKLADFGFCKRLSRNRTYTLCGTPEYLAPEVILSKGYGKAVDWWAIGVLTYELVAGYPPFSAEDPVRLYDKIVSLKYKMPRSFSNDLKDLVKNILQIDLSRRYGNKKDGVEDIKGHKWLRMINWMAILNRKVRAKYQPQCDNPGDTKYFQVLSWIQPKISKDEKYAEQFEDF